MELRFIVDHPLFSLVAILGGCSLFGAAVGEVCGRPRTGAIVGLSAGVVLGSVAVIGLFILLMALGLMGGGVVIW